MPADIRSCSSYVEPFVGGGSVLFRMLELFEFDTVHVSDLNPELMLCYRTIREDAGAVADHLLSLSEMYPSDKEGQKAVYYSIRDEWNAGVGKEGQIEGGDVATRAAKTIFLNKTCFNGLFRVNKSGLFNVPCNYTKRPSLSTKAELLEVQEALQGVNIRVAGFEECEGLVNEGSFVYFDPPYRPLSATSGFVSYSKEDFDDDDQRRLAELFQRLDAKGARLMLSNSDPRNANPDDDFFDELYSGFRVDRVMARRSINSVGGGRGEITEIIVTNY